MPARVWVGHNRIAVGSNLDGVKDISVSMMTLSTGTLTKSPIYFRQTQSVTTKGRYQQRFSMHERTVKWNMREADVFYRPGRDKFKFTVDVLFILFDDYYDTGSNKNRKDTFMWSYCSHIASGNKTYLPKV